MLKFLVLSRLEFEEFKSDEPFITISITDPKSEPVIINGNDDNFLSMLSLQFHDVDHRVRNRKDCKLCDSTGKSKLFPDINNGHCYACTDKMDIKLFDESYAEKILEFVNNYKNDVELIVVHCEVGISRSAGVASALSLIFNGTDQYYFDNYVPNMLCYRKILNVYHKF